MSSESPSKRETFHVVLAPDFMLVTSGREHTLDDFDLKRTFTWSDSATTFASLNSHAPVAFRVLELANRRGMQAMKQALERTTGKPLGPSGDDPYWREADLQVADPSENPLTVRSSASGTEFLLGQEVVVRTSGSAGPLGAADHRPLLRYLALHLPLHPQVRHVLAQAATLPAWIQLDLYVIGPKQTVTLTFSPPAAGPANYPLPPGLKPDVVGALGAAGTASEAGVRAAVQAIEGRYPQPKPTPDALVSALRKAAAEGSPMEVWLRFLTYGQQYSYLLHGEAGQAELQTIAPLLRTASQDPDVARFRSASALAGAPGARGDRQEAARYLATAKALDALPFGTFRYVTFANLVQPPTDTSKWDKAIFEAMPSPLVANYWRHIAAYPWAANAYRDAGAIYLLRYDAAKAWTTFDLGRAVDPDWRASAMGSIANFEAVLEANQPDFF